MSFPPRWVAGCRGSIWMPAMISRRETSLLAVILPNQPPMLDARTEAEAKARLAGCRNFGGAGGGGTGGSQYPFRTDRKPLSNAPKELVAKRAISQDEFDLAKSIYLASVQAKRKAEFDLEIAKFELETIRATLMQFSDPDLETNYEPFEIHAPVSGKVLRRFEESATVVTEGTPLMEVGDPQNLEVEIDVLSTDAVRIRPGAEVLIEHWGGGMPLRGVVRVVEPAAFTKISSLGVEEQRVNIIVDFDEPPYRYERLGDGYRVEAAITVDYLEDVVQVPNSALFRHEGTWHVFTIEEGIAKRVPVSIGAQSDVETEVRGGLETGDTVIVYPSDEITNGSAVQPVTNEKDMALKSAESK